MIEPGIKVQKFGTSGSYEKDAGNLTATIGQLISELKRVAAAVVPDILQRLSKLAPIASPAFTGKIGVPVLTDDPGDPAEGVAFAFVADFGGGGDPSFRVRMKKDGIVLESSQQLT